MQEHKVQAKEKHIRTGNKERVVTLYARADSIRQKELLAHGLDPALGFLHAIQDGRPSLACDFLEPIRSPLDRLVIKIMNLGSITAENFEETKHGLRLLPDPFKKFLDYLEKAEETLLNDVKPLLTRTLSIIRQEGREKE